MAHLIETDLESLQWLTTLGHLYTSLQTQNVVDFHAWACQDVSITHDKSGHEIILK